jgi:hypothetical protein
MMWRPIYETHHVVNMDAYYKSPNALIMLKKHGIYSHGTVKHNICLTPESTLWSKLEDKQATNKGTIRLAMNNQNNTGILALG